MWLLFTASVFLTLGFIHPVSVSLPAPPEDLEASGYDADGSGSGDVSELVSFSETKNIKEELTSKNGRVFVAKAGNTSKNTLKGSPSLTFDSKRSSSSDVTSDYVIFSNSKSFMESEEVLAGIIAGGVTGAILGATLSAILIYKWKKKDEEEHLKKASGFKTTLRLVLKTDTTGTLYVPEEQL